MDKLLIFLNIAGGIGLFLLGMIVLTDGLRALAGSAMRSALMRFTKSPLTGALTGAVSTAILQASGVTTVAAVGFVGAGLITFPEALGIIFGANIGTTLKGWVIAVLGFKLSLGNVFLPIVFIGAVLRLFSKGRLADIGYAIAGFGLVFVGLTFMQGSMGELRGFVSFENLPADTLPGRLLLVALGLVFTVITQSSSVSVAAALTALYADLINFNQAAALVIGMDLGTTSTAALATIGGSVGVKRTGFSHVIFNILTAVLALLLINPFALTWNYFSLGELNSNAEIALVAFHTCFNILGVIIILPFTNRFARFMEKLIPERASVYTQKLDSAVLEDADLALNAAQSAISTLSTALFLHVNAILGDKERGKRADLEELQTALNDTHAFLDRIKPGSTEGAEWERLLNMFHTLDHLQRLHERCEEDEDRAVTARDTPELAEECSLLISCVRSIVDDIEDNNWLQAAEKANDASSKIHLKVRPYRRSVMAGIARGTYDVYLGTGKLEAVRWLRRVSRHVARITEHVQLAVLASGK
ncbi:MAG: Na/Pi symporter [Thermodesulfobacteriota bacterium]